MIIYAILNQDNERRFMEHRINVVIEKELRQELKVKAAQQGKTIRQIVIELIQKWVKK